MPSSPRSVPLASPLNSLRTVIRAGIWSILHGYGNLRIATHEAPSGCHLRCEFRCGERVAVPLFRYSTASRHRFLEAHTSVELSPRIRAAGLARAILAILPPDPLARCRGPVRPETLAWLNALEDRLACGYIPLGTPDPDDDPRFWKLLSPRGRPPARMAAPPPDRWECEPTDDLAGTPP